jgi:GT2 family glycosyltransferase
MPVPPLVSVVIPTFNRCHLVQQALDSVLAQTFNDLEIIVVDDGSTDGTDQALTQYGDRIRYVWQENQGESAARNHGIALAKGRYIAFLDSDDLWRPDKLTRQIALLERSADIGLVFCQAQMIDERGWVIPGPPIGAESEHVRPDFENLCRRNFIAPSTVVMRRTLLDATGGFDETIRYGEDWDLWLRCALVSQLQGVHEPLASVRIHSSGQWWSPKPDKVQRVLADHIRLLNKAFAQWTNQSKAAQALRARCLAYEYGRAALANYAFEQNELARVQLQEAIRLDPQYWGEPESVSRELLDMALRIGQANSDDLKTARTYVRNAVRNLPPQLLSLSSEIKRLTAQVDIELGYHFLATGATNLARSCLTRGVIADPRRVRNRGLSAELLRLWFGPRSVQIARQLLLKPVYQVFRCLQLRS